MDPSSTEDGKPYGPWRFKEIAKMAYAISHQIHTSYHDVLQMTPRERDCLCELISGEMDRLRKSIDDLKSKSKKSNSLRR